MCKNISLFQGSYEREDRNKCNRPGTNTDITGKFPFTQLKSKLVESIALDKQKDMKDLILSFGKHINLDLSSVKIVKYNLKS